MYAHCPLYKTCSETIVDATDVIMDRHMPKRAQGVWTARLENTNLLA